MLMGDVEASVVSSYRACGRMDKWRRSLRSWGPPLLVVNISDYYY